MERMSFSVRTPAFRGTMGGAVQDAHTRRVISRREVRRHDSDDDSVAHDSDLWDGLKDCTETANTPVQMEQVDPLILGRDPPSERRCDAWESGETNTAAAGAEEAPQTIELQSTHEPSTRDLHVAAELGHETRCPEIQEATGESMDSTVLLHAEQTDIADSSAVRDETENIPAQPEVTAEIPEFPPCNAHEKAEADVELSNAAKVMKNYDVPSSPSQRPSRCAGRSTKYDHVKSRLFEITAASRAKIVSHERRSHNVSPLAESYQPISSTAAVLGLGADNLGKQPNTSKASGLASGLLGNGQQMLGARVHVSAVGKKNSTAIRRPSTQGSRATSSLPRPLFDSKGPQPCSFGLRSKLASLDAESFLREVLEGGKTIRQELQASPCQRPIIFLANK